MRETKNEKENENHHEGRRIIIIKERGGEDDGSIKTQSDAIATLLPTGIYIGQVFNV